MNTIFEDVFISENAPYLRPYICNGKFEEAGVLLAGINPATPIYSYDVNLENYIKLLSNYDEFINYYAASRIKVGKSKFSRTRQGIISLVKWICSELETCVIETDIYTYPTKSIKELANVKDEYLSASKDLFWKVLTNSNSTIAILYGSKAFFDFYELLKDKNISYKILHDENILSSKIANLEDVSPLIEIALPNRNVIVFAIRHLMYYGIQGTSFSVFRQRLRKFAYDLRTK